MQPVLPQQAVLTDENFEERIKESEKTVVLFYIRCKKYPETTQHFYSPPPPSGSVESKVLLHHFMGAWEELDSGSVDPGVHRESL